MFFILFILEKSEIWKKGVGVFSFFDVYKIDNRVLNCDGMSKRVGFD